MPSPRFTTVAGLSPAAILQNPPPPAMCPLEIPGLAPGVSDSLVASSPSECLAQLLPELFAGVLVGGRRPLDFRELLEQRALLRRQLGGRPHVHAHVEIAASALAHTWQTLAAQ